MMKTLKIYLLATMLGLTACGNATSETAEAGTPDISTAKPGAVTIRALSKVFRDGGETCMVNVAEMNNTDRDFSTFQIMKYQSETSLGVTNRHSTNYKSLDSGQVRLSQLWVKASSCEEVKEVEILELVCGLKNPNNYTCDFGAEYIVESGPGVILIKGFDF